MLVVEHETSLRLELTLHLGSAYDVAAVASAGEALRLVALGASFDLVLCELTMPEMNGVQLCEHLAEIESKLASRVVLMSRGIAPASVQRALEALPNPCITGPFEIDALARLLERHRAQTVSDDVPRKRQVHSGQAEQTDAACVFALAVRLIRGEVFDLVDEHDRLWHASATTLELVSPRGGGPMPVIARGCAADVALEVIRRGLRARSRSDARSGTA